MAKTDDEPILTGEQMRAGRALLRIEQAELARLSKVSLPSIKKFECVEGPIVARERTIEALRLALEKAGIEIIAENGGGAGVRLKKRRRRS